MINKEIKTITSKFVETFNPKTIYLVLMQEMFFEIRILFLVIIGSLSWFIDISGIYLLCFL